MVAVARSSILATRVACNVAKRARLLPDHARAQLFLVHLRRWIRVAECDDHGGTLGGERTRRARGRSAGNRELASSRRLRASALRANRRWKIARLLYDSGGPRRARVARRRLRIGSDECKRAGQA